MSGNVDRAHENKVLSASATTINDMDLERFWELEEEAATESEETLSCEILFTHYKKCSRKARFWCGMILKK